ncbi:sensor histidine kinase [Phenylobacterium sp.]|uniref:sensor histidine kinase n=1 Tax=Phenylobacterium sp. TaxID=1871053 RepID=UPI002FC9D610
MRSGVFPGSSTAQGGQGPTPASGVRGVCDECDIVREADHRIANHLAMLEGFVRLKGAELVRRPMVSGGDPDVQLLLESIRAQIGALARLHRSFAADGKGSPDLGEHLRNICTPLGIALCGRIEIVQDFPPGCFVRPDQVLPITQIAAEVITNAIKYAYPAGERGVILARCRRDESGTVWIEIADNGPGLPATFDPETGGGLGFRLLRALAKQVGAVMAFDLEGPGLRFQLTLPESPSVIVV